MKGKNLLRLFVCLLAAGIAGLWIARVQFYGSAVKQERELFVSAGSGYGAVVDSLLPQLAHRRAFRLYADRIRLAETFKAGHYVLRSGMSVIEVARMLKLGLQTPVRVTLNNVRTPGQLAARLGRQLDADSAAFARVLASAETAERYGFDSVTLFSMFLPNTYEV